MKSEDYQEKIKDLEETIAVLTAQRKTMAEGMLPKNVDTYAIKFMQEITKEDIEFVSTKELFDRFVEYRRQFTTRNEQLLSLWFSTTRLTFCTISNFITFCMEKIIYNPFPFV